MRLNREAFLARLESVRPGCSAKEVIEQSHCFAFKNGDVFTFNGEVACRAGSGLEKTFEGAVRAGSLISILQKLADEEIEVTTNGKLIIRGAGHSTTLNAEDKIHLPIDYVESPKVWTQLHEDFEEAVGMVKECAGKEAANFAVTCVHLHPKWVEATDTCQVMRYKVPTGVRQSILVRRDSIKHLASMGMSHISEAENWIHFKNDTLTMSFSRYPLDQDMGLGDSLKGKGSPIKFPKGLSQVAQRAEVFSSENSIEGNLVRVSLEPGKLTVEGTGVSGTHKARRKVIYSGPPISFMIAPKLLGDIAERYDDCQISEDRITVNGGKWRYVSFLGRGDA